MSSKETKPTNRSPDFRYIPAESLGFSFGENGCKIVLGIEDMDGSVFEQMGVYLSNRAAKTLAFLLTESTSAYEKKTGQEIVVDKDALEEIGKSLRAHYEEPKGEEPVA